MKIFEKPEMAVIRFQNEDIIMTSRWITIVNEEEKIEKQETDLDEF